MNKTTMLIILGLAINLLGGTVALATATIAPDLRADLDAGAPQIRAIVTFDETAPETRIDQLAAAGYEPRLRHQTVRAVSGRFFRDELESLAADPAVRSISPDRIVRGNLDVTVEATGAARIGEHLGYSGDGVTVAVIDSGISPSTHVSAERIVVAVDFTGTDLVDGYGHGTHVAGIIGGAAEPAGIAPAVDFVSLKVLDAQGEGRVSSVIRAIDWLVENHERYGIRLVNMSLGHPVVESFRTDPLTRAVERAWSAGITVIVSAGNRGRDGFMTINSPGNDPYVLTVGAMNDLNTAVRADDVITTYSSRGPSLIDHVVKPDLVAPGNRIVSTLAAGATLGDMFPEQIVGDDRIELSGTSMAAGVVSGAAAILLERNEALTNDQLKALLMLSADPFERELVYEYGAGYLHVVRAVAMTSTVGPVYFNSASPIVVKTDDAAGYRLTDPGTLVRADGVLWGDGALWADGVLWGDGALWADGVLWGDGALWADGVLWGDGALWADGVLWGDGALWADGVLWGDGALWADGVLWGDGAPWADGVLWPDGVLWGDSTILGVGD